MKDRLTGTQSNRANSQADTLPEEPVAERPYCLFCADVQEAGTAG